MASPLLDFKDWQHVKSDDKSTTLKHKKQGHLLTLAHNVLSKPHQTQLKALAGIGKEDQTNSQAQEAQDQQKRKALASGGNVMPMGLDDCPPEMMAEGGESGSEETKSKENALREKLETAGNFIRKNVIGEPIGPEGTPMPRDTYNPEPQQEVRQPAQTPQTQQQTPIAPQADQAAQQVPQSPTDDMGLAQSQNLLEQGYNNQMAGLQQEASAKGQLGTQQANQLESNIQAQNAAMSSYQDSYRKLEDERAGIMHDIQQGHIDPEKYWTGDSEGNGGHSKIAAGLGMILAGFNPTNNPNAAVNFLRFQMEQNLKSQAQNLNSKNNLLNNNLQQFGNMRDATDMTRLQQADILHNQMIMAASKASTPLAKAEMLQKAGQLQQQYAPLRQQFVMRQAMMNMANNGTQGNDPADTRGYEHMLQYMRMMNPEQAKEMESRLVHGVGVSNSGPVPDAVRQKIIATKDANQIMNQVLDFARQHHGTLDPALRSQGQALFNELQSKIRTAEDQGVYKESEAQFMRKTLGDSPASFLANYTTVPKVKEIQQIKQNDYNNLLHTYGLPTHNLPKSEAPQYKTVNGVKYMRGPNGEAVPVK